MCCVRIWLSSDFGTLPNWSRITAELIPYRHYVSHFSVPIMIKQDLIELYPVMYSLWRLDTAVRTYIVFQCFPVYVPFYEIATASSPLHQKLLLSSANLSSHWWGKAKCMGRDTDEVRKGSLMRYGNSCNSTGVHSPSYKHHIPPDRTDIFPHHKL